MNFENILIEPPILEPQEPEEPLVKGEAAQRERLRQAIELIDQFTVNAKEGELPIVSIRTHEGITSEPGVYIIDNIGITEITDADFAVNSQLLSGTRDSGHAVVSGRLAFERSGGEKKDIDVAVKCYMKRTPEERLARAKLEVETYFEMMRLGNLAFKPRCVVVGTSEITNELCAAVMTEFDESIFSLDNVAWSNQTEKELDIAISAASALGRYNANGRRHNDAKIKNVAQDDLGKFGMIDFETTEKFDVANPYEAARCVTEDLHKLSDSLYDRGFFPDDQAERDSYLEALMESYLGAWSSAPDEIQGALIVACVGMQHDFNEMRIKKKNH